MAVSERVKEVADVIRLLEEKLGAQPTNKEIYQAVLERDGDGACSNKTITAAKRYLRDLNDLGVQSADLERIGRSVLYEVSRMANEQGGFLGVSKELIDTKAKLSSINKSAHELLYRMNEREDLDETYIEMLTSILDLSGGVEN